MIEIESLLKRFDDLRDSGVCSPTTRGLLDDAEKVILSLQAHYGDPISDVFYRCCDHCADDPAYHQDFPPNSHEVPCSSKYGESCDSGGDRRA